MNPVLIAAVVLDSLTFHMPIPGDLAAACDSLADPGDTVLSIVVERLRHDSYQWQYVDSLAGGPPGARMAIYIDKQGCRPCAYRVWTVDEVGNRSRCAPMVSKWDGAQPVGVSERWPFRLGRVTPSPVHERGAVSFSLDRSGETRLELYDLSGRVVRVLARGHMDAGPHLALFDARGLRPGVYFTRLRQGAQESRARIVVID